MNIIDLVQLEVDKLVEDRWENDPCPPTFNVYNIYDVDEHGYVDGSQALVITIDHLGSKIGRVLYPSPYNYYGQEFLSDVLESLYNQTM